MIPEYLRKNLELFKKDEYTIVTDKKAVVCLEEEEPEGRAEIQSRYASDAIIIHYPEKRVLPYLDQQKKACQCADKFLFIKNEKTGKWNLHILELKKGIRYDKWKKIRRQFELGILNARAVAGFLNIELEETFLETGFRNDWEIKNNPKNPMEMRAANSLAEVQAYREWNSGSVTLEIDSEKKTFLHSKIRLDSEGKGTVMFC